MKIDKPKNGNYCATVVEIKNIIPLENCDNVVGTTIFGFQAIVSKSTKVGDIGVVFPAETQLSDEYCYENSMYRHGDKNKNEGAKGYIEDNRRVKAVKFRGHSSSCLFVSLESFNFTKIDTSLLSVGDEFDALNGFEICKKYEVAFRISNKGAKALEKKFSRVEPKHIPEHFETSQFYKWGFEIPEEEEVIVTQKLHGTSIRVGHTLAKRKLNFFEKILVKCGVQILPHTYDYIFGSRKVIKDSNNPYQNHFYEVDIWTQEGKKIQGLLPENYIVYGEIVGYTTEGSEIQKDYTYSIEKGTCQLYIYRISIVNSQGHVTDLTWKQIKDFTNSVGLRHVPELFVGKKKDLKIEDFSDKRYFESGYKNCLYLGKNELVDEGVCIRVDGITPKIYKAKSPLFFEHETKILDAGVEDLESTQTHDNG